MSQINYKIKLGDINEQNIKLMWSQTHKIATKFGIEVIYIMTLQERGNWILAGEQSVNFQVDNDLSDQTEQKIVEILSDLILIVGADQVQSGQTTIEEFVQDTGKDTAEIIVENQTIVPK